MTTGTVWFGGRGTGRGEALGDTGTRRPRRDAGDARPDVRHLSSRPARRTGRMGSVRLNCSESRGQQSVMSSRHSPGRVARAKKSIGQENSLPGR